MASPTEAEIQTLGRNIIKLLNETRKFGDVNAQNWVGLEDAIVQSLETDFADQVTSGIQSGRSSLAAILTGGASSMLGPLLSTYGQFLGIPETDAGTILGRLFDHFVDNSLSVKSRQFTFGSPTPGGGNLGDGAILRLNTDEDTFPIENQFADAKKAECLQDQNSGTNKHEEAFEIRGQSRGRDAVQIAGAGLGSGVVRLLTAWSANNARTLQNPSFSLFTGTSLTTPTALTGWTASPVISGTNNAIIESDFYRSDIGDGGASRALQIKATQTIKQRLDVTALKLDAATPWILQLAWRRDSPSGSAASGTLKIRMGSKETTVAVLAQVGWQVARVGLAAPGDAWYQNFKEQDLDIEIEWTRTGGDLLIDEALLLPGTGFDNSWYWIIGGRTPFLRRDKFSWTDTEIGSIIQYWFWRTFGRYLPSNALGAETWTDP